LIVLVSMLAALTDSLLLVALVPDNRGKTADLCAGDCSNAPGDPLVAGRLEQVSASLLVHCGHPLQRRLGRAVQPVST
jgi:hypothetical protein